MSNAAYSDITGKMECTVKKTNLITINEEFHWQGKTFFNGLKVNEKFEILYSINTKKLSIQFVNAKNRFKKIDNAMFYYNPLHWEIFEPKRNGKWKGNHHITSNTFNLDRKFIISRDTFFATSYFYPNLYDISLKKYGENNWNGFVKLTNDFPCERCETIIYIFSFDCFSSENMREVVSYIEDYISFKDVYKLN